MDAPNTVKKGIVLRLFAAAGIVAAAGLIFYLSYAMESEKRLRIETQAELASKINELADKESALTDLNQQKNDLSDQLNTKIADLEASLKDSEDKRKELVDRVNALQKDVENRESKIDEVTQKYAAMERANLKSLGESQQPKPEPAVETPARV